MKNNKVLLFLAVILLICSLSLFAQGAEEISSDEKAVMIEGVTIADDGTYEFLVRDLDGIRILYRADETTDSLSPLGTLTAGSVLAVKDNGMMTMSIPGQTWATSIRDITLAYNNGIFDFSFDGLIPSSVKMESPSELIDRFSYGYAYEMLGSYAQQGLSLRGAYFARGFLDFYEAEDLLIPLENIVDTINSYLSAYYTAGITHGNGESPSSFDEIRALPVPADEADSFSYCYGFYVGYENAYSGITFNAEYFAKGALDVIFDLAPLMNESQRNAAIDEYIEVLQADYDKWLEEFAAENLALANAFLEMNAEAEDVITTGSGLQYVVDIPGDGAKPGPEDTVMLSYILSDLNGTVLDSGNYVTFSLSYLIPGFSEAVTQMNVGSTITAYIHPDLGYGSSVVGEIAPNSLLIFNIELHEIVVE